VWNWKRVTEGRCAIQRRAEGNRRPGACKGDDRGEKANEAKESVKSDQEDCDSDEAAAAGICCPFRSCWGWGRESLSEKANRAKREEARAAACVHSRERTKS
jgi:hypothetical protein